MILLTQPTGTARSPIQACVVAALILAFNTAHSAEGPAFQKTHDAMLVAFDRNGDGKLDAAERETMRLATKEQRLKGGGGEGLPADLLADYDTNQDGDLDEAEWGKALIAEQQILITKYDSDQDGALSESEKIVMMTDVRSVPMRYARDYCAYLLVYDKNKNREFDGNEYAQAQAAESKVVMAAYDANGNGELDEKEKGKLQADMKGGRIVGFYIRFAAATLGGDGKGKNPRGGGDGYLAAQKQLLTFDVDGDGLASAEELKAIRESKIVTR